MAAKNGVPFRRMMVNSSKWNTKCPYPMNAKKITIHNTDNQMPAENEVKYMIGNSNVTGFHVAIDEEEAIQGIEYFRNAYHAGDGSRGYGNRNTIGIEICRNYDRTRQTTNLNDPLKGQFDKAVINTIKFVAQLCIDEGIAPSHDTIKKHQDWSGKYCPSKILRDGKWNWLVDSIIKEYSRLKNGGKSNVTQVATPKPTAKPTATTANKSWYILSGSKGDKVTQLQKDLNTVGNYKLTVDGHFGAATKKALIDFQKKNKLTADGVYGAASQAKMKEAKANAPWYVMSGDKGAKVEFVQTGLRRLGHKITADGIFGPATKKTVIAFQKANGLKQDGIFGAASQKKMAELLAFREAEDAKKEANKKPTPVKTPSKAPAKPQVLHKVIVEGTSIGAFADDNNVLRAAEKALKDGAKNIKIERIEKK